VTTVVVEECVCSRIYPVCKARAPYYVVTWGQHLFIFSYFMDGMIFQKVIEHKICFNFLYKFI
jgi:hypothetical protein